MGAAVTIAAAVALRKESVDRNLAMEELRRAVWRSLSARRAWIEIRHQQHGVAQVIGSLSARRAWIEIVFLAGPADLRKRRSPQGERG